MPDTVVLVLAVVVPLDLLDPRRGSGAGAEDIAELPVRGTAVPLLALAFLFCCSRPSGFTPCRFRVPLRCCAAKQTSQ